MSVVTSRDQCWNAELVAWDLATEHFGQSPLILKRITVPQEGAPDRDEYMAVCRGKDAFCVSVDEARKRLKGEHHE